MNGMKIAKKTPTMAKRITVQLVPLTLVVATDDSSTTPQAASAELPLYRNTSNESKEARINLSWTFLTI